MQKHADIYMLTSKLFFWGHRPPYLVDLHQINLLRFQSAWGVGASLGAFCPSILPYRFSDGVTTDVVHAVCVCVTMMSLYCVIMSDDVQDDVCVGGLVVVLSNDDTSVVQTALEVF